MVVMRVGEQTAALEKPGRGQAGFAARLLQGARFRLVAIRCIEQLVLQRRDLRAGRRNSNSAPAHHCQRNSVSKVSAKRCACASNSAAAGCSKLSSTFAALTLLRLP